MHDKTYLRSKFTLMKPLHLYIPSSSNLRTLEFIFDQMQFYARPLHLVPIFYNNNRHIINPIMIITSSIDIMELVTSNCLK